MKIALIRIMKIDLISLKIALIRILKSSFNYEEYIEFNHLDKWYTIIRTKIKSDLTFAERQSPPLTVQCINTKHGIAHSLRHTNAVFRGVK